MPGGKGLGWDVLWEWELKVRWLMRWSISDGPVEIHEASPWRRTLGLVGGGSTVVKGEIFGRCEETAR